ncbi:MAG TPA: hypothetical protein VMJ34_15675 [Bryobacteraceae bacterium]|nr:hypothetical protein [Bryobacteraceae bacterium]
MADARTPVASHAAGRESGGPGRDQQAAVREALARVLASQEFRTSRRSQEFLRYVVENTLAGRTDTLKERTIGIDVFARPASYDPADDATVRVKAGEVRKRLDRYYTSEGRTDSLHIDLPAGTYIPEFRAVTPPEDKDHPATASRPPRSLSRLILVSLVAAIVIGVALYFAFRPRHADTALDEFWAPMLQGSQPVLLSAAYVPVYALDRPPGETGAPRLNEFTLLTDQFVGGGDLMAVSRLGSLLSRMNQRWQVKIGSDVSFADLRTSPTVLVGYSYTRWKEISAELRYFIDADKRPLTVTDNGKPTEWTLPRVGLDRRTDEDYAIVSRVFNPDTRTMLLEIAGATQYGTNAAAELVSRPELMAEAFRNAPSGWQHKNLQLVLHVKVISGTPASPTVVAKYFW